MQAFGTARSSIISVDKLTIPFMFLLFADVDAEAEEVLNELNLLTESEDSGMVGQLNKSEEVWGQTIGKLATRYISRT